MEQKYSEFLEKNYINEGMRQRFTIILQLWNSLQIYNIQEQYCFKNHFYFYLLTQYTYSAKHTHLSCCKPKDLIYFGFDFQLQIQASLDQIVRYMNIQNSYLPMMQVTS